MSETDFGLSTAAQPCFNTSLITICFQGGVEQLKESSMKKVSDQKLWN